ncbi:MAG: phosphohydrolase [Afipia sp. 62-7]|nr:HD domain-containing protein [Afipia sp.]OJU19838.1 MAG: phosphohydrolase [Afipia sp. 62-7]
MAALAETPQTTRRLLLASDCEDSSEELTRILRNAGSVEAISIHDLPDYPAKDFAGVVIDIDLSSPATVQRVRSKLVREAYQSLPRLFVLADSLHHGPTQAWALGATDTIQRPLDPDGILSRIRHVFPETPEDERATDARILSNGVTAALVVMSKIFRRLPAGIPLTLDDVIEAETQILRALKRSSLRQWLIAINKHHNRSYRHTLHVTGFAVAFAQHLGMREDDQRRLTRAALLHDVGKAFIPVPILNKVGKLTDEEIGVLAQHTRLGYDALKEQRGFPGEVMDVVLHHHEMLDGTGYPDGLRGSQISDIVRIITLADTYASLLEPDAETDAMTPEQAFAIMELMGDKLDSALRQAFRPVAMGL